MDFWIYWIALGIIFIIMEIFLGTLDFLAIGVAGIFTGVVVNIFALNIHDWKIVSIIFLLASIIILFITRGLILPKIQRKNFIEPMSGDKIIGLKMNIQEINKKLVVKYEGNYWNIISDDILQIGDEVKVLEMKNNKLKVKLIHNKCNNSKLV